MVVPVLVSVSAAILLLSANFIGDRSTEDDRWLGDEVGVETREDLSTELDRECLANFNMAVKFFWSLILES